jgi:outer membrane protein
MRLSYIFGSCVLAALLAIAPVSVVLAGGLFGDFKHKEAGDITVRGGALFVLPDASGKVQTQGGVDTGLRVTKIDTSVVPELDLGYFFTKNIAAQLVLGVTPHKIKTDSGIDVGKVWLLPPTLTLQYHPLPDERISPYIGAGVNFTTFFGAESGSNSLVSGFNVDPALGAAVQVGVDVALTDRWYFNVDAKKIWLNARATTDALKVENVHIDPWLVGVGFGYRF